MSADSDNMRLSLDDQLSNLDHHLGSSGDDVQMLAQIQQGISRMLSGDDDSEAEIRRVLQERYEEGALRKETYQLVKSMLDNYVTENIPTAPRNGDEESGNAGEPDPADEPELAEEPELADEPDLADEPELAEEPELAREAGVPDVSQYREMPTAANDLSAPDTEAVDDDQFSSTAVIPNEVLRPPTADDTVQVGSVLRDRFLLQERVSGGSMGVVYRAMDRRLAEAASLDPSVAIKVLSPQLARSGPALRALQQEAAKGRCLAHPGIVRFIDLDREDDLYFIVMEWLDGRTLADILDSPDGKDIEISRAIEIVRQVGKALDYAHKCGIVHADVKPGNVMILPDGNTKVFDFGIARVYQSQTDETSFDTALRNAVTPEYSSMQVLTGEEPVPADDVFSLACLLYRIVAGYRVFGPRNAAEAAEEGMKPQRLQELPSHQWNALRKALSFSRVTRFATMSEFIDALDNKLDAPIVVNDEDGFLDHDTPSNKSWLFGLFALIAVLGFAGHQFGAIDRMKALIDSPNSGPAIAPPVADTTADEQAAEPIASEQAPTADPSQADAIADSDIDAPADNIVEPGIAAVPLLDFSTLPLPDFEVELSSGFAIVSPVEVAIREDGDPVIVDLVRSAGTHLSLDVRIEEVGHSGNRSPWSTGQFEILEGSSITFPTGQDRVRITLKMASDPLREPDQQSTLRIREADSASAELAKIELALEDDDQRSFESRLPDDTIAFAVSQVAIRERDPAVQIDVLRFNPTQQPVVIGYQLKDITATEGQDYFAPGGYSIRFEPGQRTARVLIPLVQDSATEGDEAFTVELATDNSELGGDVYSRIIVMIRDDDGPAE